MNAPHLQDKQWVLQASSGIEGARAAVVNRTHRVVRDQALTRQAHKKKSRSLFAPLAICSVLLSAVFYTIWAMLDGYSLTPNGIPDASDQMMLLLVWLLPITAVALGLAWFKRGRVRNGNEEVSR